MTFKKTVGKIHLWLGLTTGLIILFLGITGCILVFEIDIRNISEPYRNVQAQKKPLLPPSSLKEIAEQHLVSKEARTVEYHGKDKAVIVSYWDGDTDEVVFLDPYSGKFLARRDLTKDFFKFILDGHNNLWLTEEIGEPIVASATLIFLIMMITGIVLWWPKNKAAAKQRFSIKWSAKWRRKNYDLHNVLGFYATWVAIFIALTGLVWGFEWFSDGVYWVSNGGKPAIETDAPESDTTNVAQYPIIEDHLFHEHITSLQPGESLTITYITENTDAAEAEINHRTGTYYNRDFYLYDQYTGKELHSTGTFAGKYNDATVADKIARMNYDIHTGAILGFPGKMLAFFASLVAASLPITGFMIWWGRRNKMKYAAPATT